MNEDQKYLYFLTGNFNKFNEVLEIFNKSKLTQYYLLTPSRTEPIEIQANSVREVAEFKINSVLDQMNDSFFVEDAGFFVDEPLYGFPGVYSSYVLTVLGNEGILKLVEGEGETKAHFESVIALYFKPTDEIKIFEGKVEGTLAKKLRGDKGFGFDPIFIPNELPDKTFSEISAEEKNKISHRGQAFSKLIDFLKENI